MTHSNVHHWLQPLGWLIFVSYSIYPIYGGKMTFLHPLRQRPLNVVSEILKLAWAGFRSGTSFLGFWFDTVPRIDPVVFSIWMFYQFYYRQRNISTSYKHSRCLKKKSSTKNEWGTNVLLDNSFSPERIECIQQYHRLSSWVTFPTRDQSTQTTLAYFVLGDK